MVNALNALNEDINTILDNFIDIWGCDKEKTEIHITKDVMTVFKDGHLAYSKFKGSEITIDLAYAIMCERKLNPNYVFEFA